MKKLLAIFMLCLFFISTIGYYYISQLQIATSNSQLQTAIDNNSIEQQQIALIKVPIQLPYQTDWREFEKIDGSVTHNGITYKYIGRKLTKDTMVYQCVANLQQKAIEQKAHDITKANSNQQNNSSSNLQFAKLLSMVFTNSLLDYPIGNTAIAFVTTYYLQNSFVLPNPFSRNSFQPPKAA